MRARGIALGAAIAIIVIASLVVFGIYKLQQAYLSGYTALSDYAITLQKPQFKVSEVKATGNTITVTLTNLGPGEAHVYRVSLYKYSTSDVPVEKLDVIVDKAVPVGASFDVVFNIQDLSSFIFWNKPLRILVETDKGLSILSYPGLTGNIYVNIELPPWYPEVASRTRLTLEISPIGTPSTPTSVSLSSTLPACDAGNPAVFTNGEFAVAEACIYNTRNPYIGPPVIRVKVTGLAGIDYKLHLTGTMPIIKVGDNQAWNRYSAVGAGFRVYTYSVDIPVTARIDPGDTKAVTIKLPDILAGIVEYQETIPSRPYTQIIDFTEYQPEGIDDHRADEVSRPNMRALVVQTLIDNGVIIPYSPAGCRIEEDDMWYNNLTALELYQGTKKINFHTGILIRFKTPCSDVDEWTMLTVEVPINLTKGKYIIIPVFTATMEKKFLGGNGPPNAQFSAWASIVDSARQVVAWGVGISDPGTDPYDEDTILYTDAIVANIQADGTYYVQMHLQVNPDLGYHNENDYRGAIIVSKIIIIRAGEYKSICIFRFNQIPAFPFVTIDLQTGEKTIDSKVVFAPIYTPPPDRQALEYYSEAVLTPDITLYAPNANYITLSDGTNSWDLDIQMPTRSVTGIGGDTITAKIGSTDPQNTYGIYGGIAVKNIYGIVPSTGKSEGNIQDLINKGATLYVKIEYDPYNGTDLSSPEGYIELKIPIPGPNYYVIIPVVGYASGGYLRAPHYEAWGVTVTNSYGDLSTNGYDNIILETYGSGILTIRIYTGIPQGISGLFTSTYEAAIALKAVVVTPKLSISDYNIKIPLDGFPAGILLRNVQALAPASFRAYVVQVSTGNIIASWDFRALYPQNTYDLLLSITGYETQYPLTRWVAEREPTYLVVEGVRCPITG